jgi:hypothetical protein
MAHHDRVTPWFPNQSHVDTNCLLLKSYGSILGFTKMAMIKFLLPIPALHGVSRQKFKLNYEFCNGFIHFNNNRTLLFHRVRIVLGSL